MVTKLKMVIKRNKACSVLAKILMVTKPQEVDKSTKTCSVLAKILMVNRVGESNKTFVLSHHRASRSAHGGSNSY